MEAWQEIVEDFETAEPDEIDNDVDALAECLFHDVYSHAREFVKVTERGIQVGLHAERIGDREVDRACMLLLEVDNFDVGTSKEFGEKKNVAEPITTRRDRSNP